MTVGSGCRGEAEDGAELIPLGRPLDVVHRPFLGEADLEGHSVGEMGRETTEEPGVGGNVADGKWR